MQAQPKAATLPPNPTIVVPTGLGSSTITIPTSMTARDVDALKARRSELSDQLQSVDSRRSRLLTQLRTTTDETAKQGLEDRLSLLDKRQHQIETDMATIGQQLTSVPAGILASSQAPVFAGLGSGQVVAVSIVGLIFVGAPLAMGFARTLWKRSNRPALPSAALTETAQRLERLESSVDTIAVEIERISEGQRFVTRLLSEGHAAPALGAGQRSPESVRSGK
jgi:muconolactone delta-isomerase